VCSQYCCTVSFFLVVHFFFYFFFFHATATTEIYTLSLHDALPIYFRERRALGALLPCESRAGREPQTRPVGVDTSRTYRPQAARSEEHTSELQSRFDLVCRLLLEKKKKK